jgi:SAM-dependent methyltransferase
MLSYLPRSPRELTIQAIAVMPSLRCCLCSEPMAARLAPWCFRCTKCGTWGSTLPSDINGVDHHYLDEQHRVAGLSTLRRNNNALILQRLRRLGVANGARILDVGSAHGWFVLAAREAGYIADGIEPDDAVARIGDAIGVHARRGLFPDVLSKDETFDVIAFNDVLEHVVDVHGALSAVRRHLEPSGLCSVNIPNSRGLVYRVAAAGRRLGVQSIFDRLWQRGLPSPHVWYFDEPGLVRLAALEGLQCVAAARLNSVERHGLWERAHVDRRPSATTVASVAAGWVAAPILNSTGASDIMHLIFQRAA